MEVETQPERPVDFSGGFNLVSIVREQPDTRDFGHLTTTHLEPNDVVLAEKKEAIVDTTPILFVPGWSIEHSTAAPVLVEFFKKTGRNIYSPQFPRWSGKRLRGEPDFNGELIRRATILNYIINSDLKDADTFDVVAQSDGVMVTLAAGLFNDKNIDRMRNASFASSAGLDGEDSLSALIARFGGHLTQDVWTGIRHPHMSKRMLKVGVGTSLYVAKNPIRALREANGIANANLYGAMRLFHDKGVKLGCCRLNQIN